MTPSKGSRCARVSVCALSYRPRAAPQHPQLLFKCGLDEIIARATRVSRRLVGKLCAKGRFGPETFCPNKPETHSARAI